MKIGFSLGRCVRDIVKGEVDVKDVVVIITQTVCHDLADLIGVIDRYMTRAGYLKGLDRDRCCDVALLLWHQGKLHQPRCLGVDVDSVLEANVWKEVV